MTIAGAAGGFLNAVLGGRGKLRKEASAKVSRAASNELTIATPQYLAPLEPKMKGRLPKGMAELLVYPMGNRESFGLLGAYGNELVQPLGSAGKPELDLNSLAIQLEQTVTILAEMASWSREKGALVDWLNRRVKDAEREPAEFELVVWDDTGFHIPWELFWLPDPVTGRRPNFLGALMTVTRWLTVRTSRVVQDFTQNPGRASGPVLAYVHEDPDPAMSLARDWELLQDVQMEDAGGRMWDLLTKLRDRNGEALAMVYAGCHGEFGDGPGQAKLGGLPLESASMLGDYGLFRLHNRPTLVFLNACASGPVGEDRRRYNDGALRGFPKMFLESGAAGVLATAAPIESDFAHQAARDLFELLRHDPGRPVARAVRDLRRQAADQLREDSWQMGKPPRQQETANGELLPVLYWFMYLYYGSPRMTISFASPDAPPP